MTGRVRRIRATPFPAAGNSAEPFRDSSVLAIPPCPMKKLLVAALAAWTASMMTLATAQTTPTAAEKEEVNAVITRANKSTLAVAACAPAADRALNATSAVPIIRCLSFFIAASLT